MNHVCTNRSVLSRFLQRLCVAASALLLICGAALAQNLVPVPPLSAHVVDTAGTLSASERAQLDARLTTIEQQSGSQVAVLIVPTTQPEDIAAYGIRVADAWKVGRKNIDDGVIVLVATQDRRLRIEVGRGLEGAIPDVTAKHIIDESITPAFKQGDFYGGLAAGVERIAALIGAEALPVPAQPARNRNGGGSLFGVIGIFIFILLVLFRRSAGNSYYASRGSMASQMAQGAILGGLLGGGRGGGGWSGGGGGWSGGGGGGFGGGGASGGW